MLSNSVATKFIAFLKRDFKTAASYRLNFVSQGFRILITTFSFFLVSKMFDGQASPLLEPYGSHYFPFVLIGVALTDFIATSTNTFSNEIRTAQVLGTLESLLVTPTSINTILFSSFTYKLLATSLRILFYFLLGICVFGVSFPSIDITALILSFILTLVPLFGVGLLSATFILVFKQGNPVGSLIAMTSALLGGVIYPVSVLPGWLVPFSNILPVTHGLEAIRQVLLNGAGIHEIQNQLYILCILSLLFVALGSTSIYYGLKIAKKEGSLLHY